MNNQEFLQTQAKWLLDDLKIAHLRGVTARWNEENQTAVMTFYFDREPTENEIEEASVICTEIIATFSNGLLEENYLVWVSSKRLPSCPYWVYIREDEQSHFE